MNAFHCVFNCDPPISTRWIGNSRPTFLLDCHLFGGCWVMQPTQCQESHGWHLIAHSRHTVCGRVRFVWLEFNREVFTGQWPGTTDKPFTAWMSCLRLRHLLLMLSALNRITQLFWTHVPFWELLEELVGEGLWIRCPCTVNTWRNQSLFPCTKTPSCFQFPGERWTFDSLKRFPFYMVGVEVFFDVYKALRVAEDTSRLAIYLHPPPLIFEQESARTVWSRLTSLSDLAFCLWFSG